MTSPFLPLANGGSLAASALPLSETAAFRKALLDRTAAGAHLAWLGAVPRGDHAYRLYALILDEDGLALAATELDGPSYPALTPELPAAQAFEREIYESVGLRPDGHPWLKPLRFPAPEAAIGETDFFRLDGAEVHEVAVGPVHAGVIEPGHFRFQCHGEQVFHLEISLGYQHRGVERALRGGPHPQSIHHAETLAGDSTIGHASAYSRLLESLGDVTPPPRARRIRSLAAELERLANHIGDLGALSGDVGFLPCAQACGRLRGDALNITALLCGNRFGRGLVRPGGVRFDWHGDTAREAHTRLRALERDLRPVIDLFFATPSVVARVEGLGRLDRETARRIGLVGVAARACGCTDDIRHTCPYDAYDLDAPAAVIGTGGDCLARARVRADEIAASLEFLHRQLGALEAETAAPQLVPCPAPRPDRFAVALGEGWRGRICHLAFTDHAGRFAFYKVVDPSFHNWFGLALALRDEAISDFPLCNKSFNLSYCGHDL